MWTAVVQNGHPDLSLVFVCLPWRARERGSTMSTARKNRACSYVAAMCVQFSASRNCFAFEGSVAVFPSPLSAENTQISRTAEITHTLPVDLVLVPLPRPRPDEMRPPPLGREIRDSLRCNTSPALIVLKGETERIAENEACES